MHNEINCTFEFLNTADCISWLECLNQIQHVAASSTLDISASAVFVSVEQGLETGVGAAGKEVVSLSPDGKIERDDEAKSSLVDLSVKLDFLTFSNETKATMEVFIAAASDILAVFPFGKAAVLV